MRQFTDAQYKMTTFVNFMYVFPKLEESHIIMQEYWQYTLSKIMSMHIHVLNLYLRKYIENIGKRLQ